MVATASGGTGLVVLALGLEMVLGLVALVTLEVTLKGWIETLGDWQQHLQPWLAALATTPQATLAPALPVFLLPSSPPCAGGQWWAVSSSLNH